MIQRSSPALPIVSSVMGTVSILTWLWCRRYMWNVPLFNVVWAVGGILAGIAVVGAFYGKGSWVYRGASLVCGLFGLCLWGVLLLMSGSQLS